MEQNQIDTYNISSNILNNLSVGLDASLNSASNYYIGVDSITSPDTYGYYPSTPNIVSVPGNSILYNIAPFYYELSIVDDDCFRLRSNRKRLKLEFCL